MATPEAPLDPPARRNRVALALLAAGFALAAAVWALSPPPAPEDPEVADMLRSRPYARQVELIGGKANAFAADANALVARAWEGRNRAYTLAGGTVLVAALYWLAARAAEEHRRESER
jgi:hypothetical protein